MFDELKKDLSSFRTLSLLLAAAATIYLLQVFLQVLNIFSDIVLIIVFAWLLSFLLEPVVTFVSSRLKISTVLSTLLIYILFGAVFTAGIYYLIPTVSTQIQSIANLLPIYLSSAPEFIQKTNLNFFDSFSNYIYILPSVAQFLMYFITILVLSFYLIVEKNTIAKTIYKISPRRWHPHLTFSQQVIDQTIVSFLRIQIIFGVIAGIMAYVLLVIFGIEFAPTTAILTAILTFVPAVGPIIGLIPPFLVSFVIDPSKALLIVAILLVANQIVYNLFGPKLIGKAFKIHPIIVLLSLLIGFKIAGLIGGIFAVPIISMATIIGKEVLGFNSKQE